MFGMFEMFGVFDLSEEPMKGYRKLLAASG